MSYLNSIDVKDPGRHAEGAGSQRPQSRGDPGQDSPAAEGHGWGQLARLHQQDSEECSQCGKPQQRRSGQGERSSPIVFSKLAYLKFPIIRQN